MNSIRRMLAVTRETLRRHLPAGVFHAIRMAWWTGRWYIPKRIKARFRQSTARVGSFPSGSNSLAAQILPVNLAAPTGMCHVMTRFGSDKGRDWHNYTTLYSALLGPLRHRPLRIFELGLGTNRPEFAFNMGEHGRPGASLRGWRDLFPRASVFGADIDRSVLFRDHRIETFYCDQLDTGSVRQLWLQPALRQPMDLIVDDGLHTFEANMCFLRGSLPHLAPGGFYIVEDLHRDTLPLWRDALPDLAAQFPDCEFALAELPNPHNAQDNNLLIVRRHP